MNYEKAYKEALERAKSFQEKYGGDYAGYIFPELRESEDERIRKELVAFFAEDVRGYYWHDLDVADILAWLEKQKEQKPAEWSEEDKEHLESVMHRTEVYVGRNLFGKIKEDFEWLKELPNRFQLQPKQEWSEEDERILKGIIGKIDHDQTYGVSKDEMLNFLKKL